MSAYAARRNNDTQSEMQHAVDTNTVAFRGQTGRPVGQAPLRALYKVADAVVLLNLSRSQIYDLIRTGRLRTVTEGRSRLIPASAISDYVELLQREAG